MSITHCTGTVGKYRDAKKIEAYLEQRENAISSIVLTVYS